MPFSKQMSQQITTTTTIIKELIKTKQIGERTSKSYNQKSLNNNNNKNNKKREKNEE